MDKLPISWRGRPAPARRGFEVARLLERGGAVVVLIKAAEIADTDIMPRLLSQLREPAQSNERSVMFRGDARDGRPERAGLNPPTDSRARVAFAQGRAKCIQIRQFLRN